MDKSKLKKRYIIASFLAVILGERIFFEEITSWV